jgi:hypothetical protein
MSAAVVHYAVDYLKGYKTTFAAASAAWQVYILVLCGLYIIMQGHIYRGYMLRYVQRIYYGLHTFCAPYFFF